MGIPHRSSTSPTFISFSPSPRTILARYPSSMHSISTVALSFNIKWDLLCNVNLRDHLVTITITLPTRSNRKGKDPLFQLHKVLHPEKLYHLPFSTTLQYYPALHGKKKEILQKEIADGGTTSASHI